jgi:imidazolonepropionase-like amidohydrolase
MYTTVYKNANVIPVSTDGVLKGYDVYVNVAEITRIVPTGEDIPEGAVVIDCTGKYIIPGLIDAHMHIIEKTYLTDIKLYAAFGVTSIRNMWGNQSMTEQEIDTFKLKCDIEGGQVFGPTLVNTSRIFDGAYNLQPSSRTVRTKAAARLMLEQAMVEKADQIKIYNSIQPEILDYLYKLSKEKGINLVGHKPLDCDDETFFRYSHSVEHTVTFNEKYMDALIQSNCYFVPTMMIEHQVGVTTGEVEGEFFAKYEKYIKYDDPNNVAMVDSLAKSARQNPALFRSYLAPYIFDDEIMMKKVKKYIASGKLPAAGTDGAAYTSPGVNLHSELSYMSKAGMTNQEILCAGTLQGARVLQLEDRKGTIESCKEADMLILNSNPLEDINNTLDINGVVLRGRYLDRAALDKILNEVLENNKKIQTELENNKNDEDMSKYFSAAEK